MKYYLDCEFDGFKGPLVSIALVREDGEGLYAIMDYTCTDGWVELNVAPILREAPLDRIRFLHTCANHRDVSHMLEGYFEGDNDIRVIADWPDDIKYLCQLLIVGPGEMIDIPGIEFEVVRVDAYPSKLLGVVQHNAWWDAQALRYFLTNEYI